MFRQPVGGSPLKSQALLMFVEIGLGSSLLMLPLDMLTHFPSLKHECDRPRLNYASVPANNNLKSRFGAKFLYICGNLLHEASTSGCCSRETEA